MKVLNLYAGIGGNRKHWRNCQVVAVESNQDIARVYQRLIEGGYILNNKFSIKKVL